MLDCESKGCIEALSLGLLKASLSVPPGDNIQLDRKGHPNLHGAYKYQSGEHHARNRTLSVKLSFRYRFLNFPSAVLCSIVMEQIV